jgi:hypothetical protein
VRILSEWATIQELSDFALSCGVAQDLCWTAVAFREPDLLCDFSGGITDANAEKMVLAIQLLKTIAPLESNPTATGAAPDGNK